MHIRSAAIFGAAILLVCGASVRCGAQTADAREIGAPASAAASSVPRLVQFNGTLKDTAARPVSGVASVTFAIYAEQEGGSALWTETQNVLADSNGHFNALLGTATTGGFPSELFSTGQSRWLGISIARQPEMPRVMLASVPYAMKAGDADTLGGLPASSYVTAQQLAARGVATPSTTIISSPFATSSAPATTAPTADATELLGGNPGPQASITGTGTANYLPLWTSGTNLGVSKIYQANGGFVGINTNTPLLQLDVNGNSIFRGSFQMAPQGTATASAGQPSHSFQWQGSVYNSSRKAAQNEAFGFRTVPDQNNTSSPTTKLDLFYGPGGGTLNDLGLSIDHTGLITFVPSQNFNGNTANFSAMTFSGATNHLVSLAGTTFLGTYGGTDNIFLGLGAGGGLAESSSAGQNAAVGYGALHNVSSGSRDTAMGYIALYADNSGTDNTAIGYGAIEQTSTGNGNTALGSNTLGSVTTGSYNTAIGNLAGTSTSGGNYNTFLGYNTNTGGPNAATISNGTAIGMNAVVAENNAIVLGGTDTHGPPVEVGIGTQTPNYQLDIEDQAVGTGPFVVISGIDGHTAVAGYNNNASGGAGSNGAIFYTASTNVGSHALQAIGSGTASGNAGYFEGNVQVTGTLTKGGGSFKIDDPIDPSGKYLSHSFVESPDMMNIYNGIVTLDAKGCATITMPEWFSALNRDFRYQLTSIGVAAPKLHVAAKMEGNQFKIAGGRKGQEISWEVTGIRQDAWANAHRIPTEQDKVGDENGKYLHPELFGAGPDKAIGAGAVPVVAQSPAAGAPAPATSNANANATGRK
jgi:hypothetical protein